ncbi:hypothetical protein [Streptomyces prasinus]
MPRTTRSRTYSVSEGLLDEWVERWRSDIVRLRRTRQARHGLGGTLTVLSGVHHVNYPGATGLPSTSRPRLTVAARCGLCVPPTLLTDDAERARRFICDRGPAVCKPLYSGDCTGRDGANA